MDRRHLTYFIAIVEAGSISGAARRLHLSQPAVSQGLKELERELRTPLVQRGRSMSLTPAGRALVAPARRVLRAFDGARAAAEQVDHLATGVLDIAAAPLYSIDLVPLIKCFSEEYPGVRLRIHEAAPGADGFETLRRAEAELLVCGQPAPYPKHRAVRLPDTRMMAVFPPGTEGLPDGDLLMDELIGHKFVLTLAQESTIRIWFGAEASASGLTSLPTVVETAPRDVFIPLVLAGVGATVLPESEARAAERLGAVVRTLGFVIPRPSHLFHRSDPLSPAAQAFVDMALIGAAQRDSRVSESQDSANEQDPLSRT